jgi:YD repeat-containing protein
MKLFILLFLALFLSFCSYAQEYASSFMSFHLRLPNSSQLKENKVAQIDGYDFNEDSTSELSEIWYVDTNGNILKYELEGIAAEDSVFDYTLYHYENNRLVSKLQIGEWNTVGRLDTVSTSYFYNPDGLLQKIRTEGFYSYEINYIYQGRKLRYEIKTDTSAYGQIWNDSNIYNENGQLVRTVYSKHEAYWQYYYDENHQLIEKVMYDQNDTSNVIGRVVFKYSAGKLVYEEVHNNPGNRYENKRIYRYSYNENGLIELVEKLKDGKYIKTRAYTYIEF